MSSNNYSIRSHQPGDAGWVIHRHGIWYFNEHDFDPKFEGLVAGIMAQFIEQENVRENLWIGSVEDKNVGSIMITQMSDTVAQLRLFFVESETRGMGLGSALLNECIQFCEVNEYHKITLWTQDFSKGARHLYAKAGFNIVTKQNDTFFGQPLIIENWELCLGQKK